MQHLISVIVPVYNVEQYLIPCVESILAQTYTDLEIWLVDDGFNDNSGAICDDYAARDSRIHVIHKRNGGAADARNQAIDVATGEYISFVDSDDYIHPRMMERLLEAALAEDADIVLCQWQRVLQQRYFDTEESRIGLTVPYAKLYRADCFAHYRYPVGKQHEDEFVTFKLLYEAEQIVETEDVLYFYRSRESSVMGQFSVKRFALFDGYLEKLNYYLLKDEKELAKRTLFLAIHMLVQYYEWIDRSDEDSRQTLRCHYERWRLKCGEVAGKLNCNIRNKMEIAIFSHFFLVYIFAWEMKHAQKH